jgi:hypothetical protein
MHSTGLLCIIHAENMETSYPDKLCFLRLPGFADHTHTCTGTHRLPCTCFGSTAYMSVKRWNGPKLKTGVPLGNFCPMSGNLDGEAGSSSALSCLLLTKCLRSASTGEKKAPRWKQVFSGGSWPWTHRCDQCWTEDQVGFLEEGTEA